MWLNVFFTFVILIVGFVAIYFINNSRSLLAGKPADVLRFLMTEHGLRQELF